jgi:hypothetical protein
MNESSVNTASYSAFKLQLKVLEELYNMGDINNMENNLFT